MNLGTKWFSRGGVWAVILALYFVAVSTYIAAPAGALAIMNLIIAVPIVAVFIVCWRIVWSVITGRIVNPLTGVEIKRDRH